MDGSELEAIVYVQLPGTSLQFHIAWIKWIHRWDIIIIIIIVIFFVFRLKNYEEICREEHEFEL